MEFIKWIIILPGLVIISLVHIIIHVSINNEFSKIENSAIMPEEFHIGKKLINGSLIYFIIVLMTTILYIGVN